MRRLSLAALSLAIMGCSGEDDSSGTGTGAEPKGSGGGSEAVCAVDETLLEDGSCLAPGAEAGIPPSECAFGFEPVDESCEPILPSEPCPAGTMALPGDEACAPVAECGTGTWGDIATDATTQFVDQSYAGGDSDGSEAKPWTTLAEALAAAEDGATVAVAAGSYQEDLSVIAPVTIAGRCPEMVEVIGGDQVMASFTVNAPSTIRGLRFSGPAAAVLVQQGPVVLEDLWVADTGFAGLMLAAETDVRHCLLEGMTDTAVFVRGAEVRVEDTVIQDNHWRAFDVDRAGAEPQLTITRSILQRNVEVGLYQIGGRLDISGSIIRDTATLYDDYGIGLFVVSSAFTLSPAQVTVRSSLFERNAMANINFAGVEGLVETSVVRDGQPLPDGTVGRGIVVLQDFETGVRGNTEVRHCLFSDNRSSAMAMNATTLRVDRTIVRDTHPTAAGAFGRGIDGQDVVAPDQPARLEVLGCRLERNHSAGVMMIGGELIVEDTAIIDTQVEEDFGTFGRGINLQANDEDLIPAKGTIRRTRVDGCYDAGIIATASDMSVERSLVREVRSDAVNNVGTGIVSQSWMGVAAQATVSDCEIRRAHGIGILAYDASMTVTSTRVLEPQPQEQEGLYGDGFMALSLSPVDIAVDGLVVDHAARTGLSLFGATVQLSNSRLECVPIDLDAYGQASFIDAGGNQCGCDDDREECKVLSTGLEPPTPPSPFEE